MLNFKLQMRCCRMQIEPEACIWYDCTKPWLIADPPYTDFDSAVLNKQLPRVLWCPANKSLFGNTRSQDPNCIRVLRMTSRRFALDIGKISFVASRTSTRRLHGWSGDCLIEQVRVASRATIARHAPRCYAHRYNIPCVATEARTPCRQWLVCVAPHVIHNTCAVVTFLWVAFDCCDRDLHTGLA